MTALIFLDGQQLFANNTSTVSLLVIKIAASRKSACVVSLYLCMFV